MSTFRPAAGGFKLALGLAAATVSFRRGRDAALEDAWLLGGGFPIEITEINTRPHELIVFFTMLSPPPGFPLGVGVVRQPYHIVRVERLSLPVVFQEKS